MSDTKYWRIRGFIESAMEKGAFPCHYADLISGLDGSLQDTFYLGMIVHEFVLQGKLSWDIRRFLHLSGEKTQ